MKQHELKLLGLSLSLTLMSGLATVTRSQDFEAELLHTEGSWATSTRGVHVERGISPIIRIAGYEQVNEGDSEQPVLYTRVSPQQWTKTSLPTGIYGAGRANHVVNYGNWTYVVGKVGEPSHGAIWASSALAKFVLIYVDPSEGSELTSISSEIRQFESTCAAGHRFEEGLRRAIGIFLFNGTVLSTLELHNPKIATESWATGVHVDPYGQNRPVQFALTAMVDDTETAFYAESNIPQRWQQLHFDVFAPSIANDIWWYCLANVGFQYDEKTGGYWHAYHPIYATFKTGWEYDDLPTEQIAARADGVFGGFHHSTFYELIVGSRENPKLGIEAYAWDATMDRLITPFSLHPYLEASFGARFSSSAAHKVYMTDTAANTLWTCVSGVGFEDDGTGPKPRAIAWVRVIN